MAFNPSKYTRRGNSPSSGPSRGPMASMDAARAAARAGNTGTPRATRAGGQAPSGRNPELQRASAGMNAARSRQQSRPATTPLPSGRAAEMMRGAVDMNRSSARGTGTPTQGGSRTNMQMPGIRPQAGGTPGGPSTMNPGTMASLRAQQAGGAPPPPPSGGGSMMNMQSPAMRPGGNGATNSAAMVSGSRPTPMPAMGGSMGGAGRPTPTPTATAGAGSMASKIIGPKQMGFKEGGKTEAKKAPSGSNAKGYGMARGSKVCKIR